ncbi:MAG: hypothetical protein GF416_00495 [Candidatus Altiarchaeales archaeon]|nr:hypothetical protein [Candidatus Altiarchaeales archaeon]MBD3415597.1 hypothetical protein [Candidatus Altiarchaeales archaeon]
MSESRCAALLKVLEALLRGEKVRVDELTSAYGVSDPGQLVSLLSELGLSDVDGGVIAAGDAIGSPIPLDRMELVEEYVLGVEGAGEYRRLTNILFYGSASSGDDMVGGGVAPEKSPEELRKYVKDFIGADEVEEDR